MKTLLALGSLSLMTGQADPTALAAADHRSCTSVAGLLSPASFGKYPADTSWRGPWHAPDVRSGEAHLYRTVIRQEGVGPPDLAGHYKVVRLGCGAGLVCPAFVDLKTGGVVFLASLQSTGWDDRIGEVAGIDDFRLVYRRDSRLLVAVGTRNEQDRLTGVTLYEWRNGRPQLIRFVPESGLCQGKAAQ